MTTTHTIDEQWADECGAFDKCARCGQAIQPDYLTGQLVTMNGRRAECYGS